MPELPEAETVARQLREQLTGAVIMDCWIGREDIIRDGFSCLGWYHGARLITASRLGKCVILHAEKASETRFLIFELGMTGLLFFTLLNPSYRKHTHLTLALSGPVPALHYWNPRRFGRVYLVDQKGLRHFAARRFGRDPLSVTWPEFREMVAARRGRLKALLMHQQVIAGIGNIYANEILYRARLHPDRIAGRLRTTTVKRLYETMRDVLQQAVADGGSSVRDFLAPDGTKGEYRKRHLIYNKAGRPCPSCGRAIQRLPGERSSFVCLSCQPREKRLSWRPRGGRVEEEGPVPAGSGWEGAKRKAAVSARRRREGERAGG
jgi:formamidopyrimidine-DNA glycosylase